MKSVLLFLLIISPSLIWAQFQFTEGKDFQRSKSESFNGFIGENNLSVFTVDYISSSKKKKQLFIRQFYKNDLSLILEKDIYNNHLSTHYSVPFEIYIINDKVYLFSILTHIKEGTTTLGYTILNDQFKEEKFIVVDSIRNYKGSNIQITLTEAKDAFVISKKHIHEISFKDVISLNCLALDGHSNWRKELLSTNNIHKISIEKIVSPNKDEVFLLCNYGFNNQNNSNINESKLLTNKYTLWAYNQPLNFLKEMELRLKLKWVNGLDFLIKKDGNILVSGFVNSSRTFGINASFNLEIDKKYEIVANNYFLFNDSIIKKFLPENSPKKGLENYFLRDIAVQDDGSFFMVGEHYYTYIDRIYDPRTNTTNTVEYFNYESILVAFFDAKNQLKWVKRIPKIQTSSNDGGFYSSFSVFNSNNSIFLIFNDSEKNHERDIEKTFDIQPIYNNRKNAIQCVSVNLEGDISFVPINNSKNYLLYAKKSKQMNSKEMYLFTELGRKGKIISLRF